MKIVKRVGVFETNSSATHTLVLVSQKDFEADKAQPKPKYRKYGLIDNKEDKLLMVCGCCEEMFITEEKIDRYASWGDEYDVKRKQEHDEIKRFIANGFGDNVYISFDDFSYELAISMVVRVYCELTNKDYDKTYDAIIHNNSPRHLHMKFFDEGSLDESRYDYLEISKMFDGDESEILNNLRHYFDDDYVLLYREYFGFSNWDDDDDE